MAVKSLTFRIMIVFTIAFMAAIFALGYLVGSRPEFYGTNMAVRIQHLSNALQRCRLYLDRTQGNTAKSAFMLNQTRTVDGQLAKCEEETSSLELLREECKNRYEQDQLKSYEEPIVRSGSAIYMGLLSVRSEAGTGSIGDLIRNIDDTDSVQKKQVTRVLVKDIVEKRSISKLVLANCNASLAAWNMANSPPVAPVAPPVQPPPPPVKEVAKKDERKDEEAPPPVKKPKRKLEDEDEDAPPPRKAPRKKPVADDDEAAAAPPRKVRKDEGDDEHDRQIENALKKRRKPVKEVEDEDEAPPPPPKKKRKPVMDEQ